MKLIREEIEQVEIIVEQRNSEIYIEGIFLQGNIANRNKECMTLVFLKEK